MALTSHTSSAQGATYFGNGWAHRTSSQLFATTYCRALLLEVLGPTVRVSALYWLDKVCMVRSTVTPSHHTMLQCFPPPPLNSQPEP